MLARVRYKQRRGMLATHLEAGDFRDFVERMGYLLVARNQERELVRQIQVDRETLRHSAARLARLEERAAAEADALARARDELIRQQERGRAMLAALQKGISDSVMLLAAVQTDNAEALRGRAELLLAQGRAQTLRAQLEIWTQIAPPTPGIGSGDALVHVSMDLAPLLGKEAAPLRWPVPNAILTQGFGPSPYLFEPALAPYRHFHSGLDLAASLGTPLRSAADGVVVVATAQRSGDQYVGYGSYVVVQHAGGLRTLYAHLLRSVVKPGDAVRQGQVLGFMGSTGNFTGPHTHFEVRFQNTPIDPTVLLPKR
jgi:murein DD-endopeptidase MepM/ murein hydrolase activator NlpD